MRNLKISDLKEHIEKELRDRWADFKCEIQEKDTVLNITVFWNRKNRIHYYDATTIKITEQIKIDEIILLIENKMSKK